MDDLAQEITLIWLELAPEKQERIREQNALKWWSIRTCKNQWMSQSSPFYSKYKKFKGTDLDLEGEIADVQQEFPEPDVHYWLDVFVERLYPSEKNIVHDYWERHMTIMQIVAKYSVDKNFVWNTLQRVVKSLRRQIIWQMEGCDPRDVSEVLIEFVGRKRLKIEERQFIVDAHNRLLKSSYNNPHNREEVGKMLERLISHLKL